MGRTWVLIVSYAALLAIGFAAWHTERLYIGALAVLPLLFIAYHSRPLIALGTALASGVVLSLLADNVIPTGERVVLPPGFDAVVLSAALFGAVLTAEALRRAGTQNALLRESLQRARRDAECDALTGIPNRRYFLKRLQTAVASARESSIAVLFADLDDFKIVNDTAGHTSGDRVLQLAAERLQHAVRSNDVVARIGGDEFAILIEHLPGDDTRAPVEKVEREFRDPFQIDRQSFTVGITVGVSVAPDDGREPELLLRIADERMYAAKQAKRGRGPLHFTGSS